ncbi:hypothetical protein JAAARDRAFT_192739 [Jaapia argillacea MUCL 33604]|uniref:PITH domain-containing protein n=1 Tax=Jaapia argillacea MUCL 33604 TaxID=933084 RepID=A0A067PZ85_9AGAM|nr:hypothetical protein JAAARDRAFT_192739 [Jaapia argillacea MUCL 33604]
MSHNHGNSHCNDESHDHDHDHDHSGTDVGPKDSLFIRIDRSNVVALNADGEGPEVIKPWHQRLDEQTSLESDADDQMIIRVPFTGSVKLRAVLLKTGPADQTPAKVALVNHFTTLPHSSPSFFRAFHPVYPRFANENNLDFSDASDKKPTQEFVVPQGREVGEYAVLPAKFSNISSITLFFPASQGADTVRIYYVGFIGVWTERNTSAVVTVYESQANLADHEKIQGTDGNFSSPQL